MLARAKPPYKFTQRAKYATRTVLKSGLVSVAVILIWGMRNHSALGKFIPSKSNFWYEFYQANMADEDGIIAARTFAKYHPFSNGMYRSLYDSLGEVAFVDHMRDLSQSKFILSEYSRRVGNRINFAFLRSRKTSFWLSADTASFSARDQKLLVQEGLIEHGGWISLDYDSAVFMSILDRHELDKSSSIISDWIIKKRVYTKEKSTIRTIIKESLVSLVPTLCILALLLFYNSINKLLFKLILIIYFCQSLLYILVSHHVRYQSYLILLQSLLIYLTIIFFFEKLFQIVTSKRGFLLPS